MTASEGKEPHLVSTAYRTGSRSNPYWRRRRAQAEGRRAAAATVRGVICAAGRGRADNCQDRDDLAMTPAATADLGARRRGDVFGNGYFG